MMKKIFIIGVLAIFSCKESPKKEIVEVNVQQSGSPVYDDEKKEGDEAQKWLELHIQNYFAGDLGKLDQMMKDMTTKDYYEYKGDAMNVDMDVDGSLTQKEFEEKWKGKFDTSKAGIGTGFLITGQDWDTIKITKCKLLSQKENEFVFDVVLSDNSHQLNYPITVKVIKKDHQFFIADVLQEDIQP
ncbi:hypothetical protein CMU59_07400 [Elizabethkingia anophelis]|uniref:hypothetical protein n=1 Tax=Elizabethkingia anophelis TaxID=1117645 RepID=UPI0020129487|nr:hypothetical protein [Elizabethkingia anophelis]MCT3805917.1 hypothetical protein [Elizabethkingia anophelis]MCT3813102.1 hypothetical protein [Elizabethkingia anophelis]MCT3814612.1 hypothetical protein [Elizabethkingia anophelis]MCT3820197.1 hypothetical protein [Elizabethkingia anophelis]MCT3871859.1 hypothetical protein [Elizabethkingia anophelis]